MKTYGTYTIFLYSAGTATALFAAVLFLFWKLLAPGLHLYIPFLSFWIGLLFFLSGLISILLYVLLYYCSSSHIVHHKLINRCLSFYLRLFYTPTCLAGKLFRISKEEISRAYINFLNRLVLLQNFMVDASKVLVLIPHCLQWDKCPHKITRNVQNCHRCGHCPVGTILEMTEKNGTYLAVATGGTLARQIVKECRPQAIIAVACERDLVSGMQDVFPLPVLGLLNRRPNGPCFNTDVDTEALRLLLETMTGEDYGYTKPSITESFGNMPR